MIAHLSRIVEIQVINVH